jgi:hypothetical protein
MRGRRGLGNIVVQPACHDTHEGDEIMRKRTYSFKEDGIDLCTYHLNTVGREKPIIWWNV